MAIDRDTIAPAWFHLTLRSTFMEEGPQRVMPIGDAMRRLNVSVLTAHQNRVSAASVSRTPQQKSRGSTPS